MGREVKVWEKHGGWPGTQVVKVVVNLSKSGEDSGIRDLRGM